MVKPNVMQVKLVQIVKIEVDTIKLVNNRSRAIMISESLNSLSKNTASGCMNNVNATEVDAKEMKDLVRVEEEKNIGVESGKNDDRIYELK